MYYVVPAVGDWPGTVIAVNVGGAVIPGLLSFYLLVRYRLWLLGGFAIVVVAAVCYSLAQPVPGLGIALPVFVPPLSAAVVALILSRAWAGACLHRWLDRLLGRGRPPEFGQNTRVGGPGRVDRRRRDL